MLISGGHINTCMFFYEILILIIFLILENFKDSEFQFSSVYICLIIISEINIFIIS